MLIRSGVKDLSRWVWKRKWWVIIPAAFELTGVAVIIWFGQGSEYCAHLGRVLGGC